MTSLTSRRVPETGRPITVTGDLLGAAILAADLILWLAYIPALVLA